MKNKPREVSQWVLIRDTVFALFSIPVAMVLLALVIKYCDVIDNALK